jgi:hypothetical protein
MLYKDKEGGFFNLPLTNYTTAPVGAFIDNLSTFSAI